mgnify:FL=1
MGTTENMIIASDLEWTKTCPTCGIAKPLGDFNRNARKRDSISSSCKICSADLARAYYHAHIEKCRERRRVGHAANREQENAKHRAYYEKNRVVILEHVAARRKHNPDTFKHAVRRYKYGISPEQFRDMLDAQGDVCAICGQSETKLFQGVLCDLCVDHDHQSGTVRSLLCSGCNAAIGLIKERVSVAQALVAYIERWHAQ